MAFEQLRDRWETISPRERRLLTLVAAGLGALVLVVVLLRVTSRLSAMEDQNAQTREALRLILLHQDDILEKRNSPNDPEKIIPETALPLQTYLEGIASQAGGMTILDSTNRPEVVKGKYRELAVDIKARGVSIDQLAKFLKMAESNPAVVTQRLYVKPYVSAHEKLDVELTMATYEKAGDKGKKGAKPAKETPAEGDAEKSEN